MKGPMLLAAALGALVFAPPLGRAEATTVDHRGPRITVPAGWRVHRIGPDPPECVSSDPNAADLGPAAPEPVCPEDETEARTVPPAAQRVIGASDGADEARTVPPAAHHRVIGASDGADERVKRRVLHGTTPVPGRHRAERRRGRRARLHRWATGAGFDTCEAPSLPAMRAWRAHYVAANVYIGGVSRACPNRRLSSAWVGAVRRMGWRLIPTYVGPQAPCADFRNRFSDRRAARDGRLSAADAVRRARALGLPRRTPIYFDLEAYPRRHPRCRAAVLRFLDGWTRGLRARRFVSGVFGSLSSGVADLGRARGIRKPSTIWFAHWDGDHHARGDLPRGWWPGHHRIKQYRGAHVEKHGGFRLAIDSDAVDGYVR